MPESPMQAVEVKSICFLCIHAQVMSVELESPGVHPITGQKVTVARKMFQSICHRWNAPLAIGLNCNVQSCTEFSPLEKPKALRGIKPVGADNDQTNETKPN